MSLGEEVVDLLTHLVGYPTESRSPNLELVDFIVERVRQSGGAARVVPGAVGRANLLLRFGPEAPGGILLSGHTDVVPAGTGWASDPYLLAVDGDRLRGRGTADMKGFIACVLAVAMRQDVAHWRAPMYVGLSYDEEIGCAGVPSLLKVLAEDQGVSPDIVVVGEPTSLSLRTSHAGKVAYTVRARCTSGHSSLSPKRTNAIDEIVSIASAVAQVNSGSRDEGVSTNVGTVRGGVAVNVLAPSSELTFECRHPASTDPDEVLARVWSQIERSRVALNALDGTVEVSLDTKYPALRADPNDQAVKHLADVLSTPLAGHLEFGSEAGLYSEALGTASVVFGPGDIGDAHRPDEFVARDELAAACRSLQALADEYCGTNR